jgi:hypothetical protein
MTDASGMEASSLFTTMYTCVHHKMQCRVQCVVKWPSEVSRNVWPEICGMLDTGFGELPF